MTISQMLEQSGILTLLGMCVVFSFLVILIAAMNLLRVCIKCFKLDKKGKAASSSSELPVQNTSNSIPAVQSDTNAVIAAIACAVREKETL